MASRKRGRKGQQQRLTFEPVESVTDAAPSHSSPGGLSPARVTLASASYVQSNSPLKKQKAQGLHKAGRVKNSGKQATLNASLGNAATVSSGRRHRLVDSGVDDQLPIAVGGNFEAHRRTAPLPSFMRSSQINKSRVIELSDSDISADEIGGVSDSDGEGPLKQEPSRVHRPTRALNDSSDSDTHSLGSTQEGPARARRIAHSSPRLPTHVSKEADSDTDNEPLVTPRSSMSVGKRRKARQLATEDDEDEDEDIKTPAKRRRIIKTTTAAVSSEDDDSTSDGFLTQPRPRRRLHNRTSSPAPSNEQQSARLNTRSRRGHRSEKDKKRELLRRRKAGEKDLTMEDLTPTDDDEDDGGLYDTDSEHQALQVFDDESEAEQQQEEAVPAKTGKMSKKNKKNKGRAEMSAAPDENADSEDEAFIDDEDDTMGVPDEALHLMPLEFTRASRKPLKAHFRDAIEWLIHRKINPAFDRDNEVYTTAWRRLNDEVTGMAYSKFFSGAWRPDFMKALRARPYIEQVELGPASLAAEFSHCQACGRSGHPATWSITFRGKPYDQKTLDEIESESDEEDEDFDRDAEGNPIPSEDKEYPVGSTCNIMAETAHSLLHWKLALRDWVEDRLRVEHWLDEDKILLREKMKAKKRFKLADQIVQDWEEKGIIKNLFIEFKNNIEAARNLDTAKVSRHRRR